MIGGGWSWVEVGVRFSNTHKKHKIDFLKKSEYSCTYFHLVNLYGPHVTTNFDL